MVGWGGGGPGARPDPVWFPPVSPGLGGEPGWWVGGERAGGRERPGARPEPAWFSPISPWLGGGRTRLGIIYKIYIVYIYM